MIGANLTADECVSVLDARYAHWDLYKLAGGGWNVVLGTDSVRADTLTDALRGAVIFVAEPVIPPRPRPRYRNGFTPRRAGSWWRLEYCGEDCSVRVKTKEAAERLADEIAERTQAAHAEWESKYGSARVHRVGAEVGR